MQEMLFETIYELGRERLGSLIASLEAEPLPDAKARTVFHISPELAREYGLEFPVAAVTEGELRIITFWDAHSREPINSVLEWKRINETVPLADLGK
jgi:hypothetical protein